MQREFILNLEDSKDDIIFRCRICDVAFRLNEHDGEQCAGNRNL